MAYINESTKAKDGQEGVDVTLTGKVEASPNMATWAADPMRVPVRAYRTILVIMT